MEIFVCIKRVPDVSDAEVAIAGDGRSIVAGDLEFGMNEWDNFAIEEAIRLRDGHGGQVTVVSIGSEDVEDELRRALAMGADESIRIDDGGLEDLDALGAARLLGALLADRTFDLILTGAVSSDTGSGQIGGLLAGLLDVPQVALATNVAIENRTATVQHEVEGGKERVVQVDLPAVISVQTGLNEPRYVSIRGIRRVSGVEIPVVSGAELAQDTVVAPRVRLEALQAPPAGKKAEILTGDVDSMVDVLVDRLKEKGGL
jgi:electron transfer flavoprotein beta subunit